MATTKIWPVRGWLGQVVHYVENKEKTAGTVFTEQDIQGLRDVMDYALQDYKTEKQFYVSGINCIPDIARQEMLLTKKQFGKEGGIVAFHAYQSFKPGEVTPDQAHALGKQLARELWGDRFQVLIATHLDKSHIHNHFVLNSVSFIDGKRYNDCKTTYALLRSTSDRICLENSLSVIENPGRGKHRSYDLWQAERDGQPTWWNIIRADIDTAMRGAMFMKEFYYNLRKLGYEIKYGKHVSVRPQGKKRFVRLDTLGGDHTENAIRERIEKLLMPKLPKSQTTPTAKRFRVHGDFRLSKITFKGLQALFFHYLYLLRKARSHPQERVPFALREDLRKLDEFSRQTVLLMKNKIETPEQLAEFKHTAQKCMGDLVSEREILNNRIRRSPEADQAEEWKRQRTALTNEITKLRKDVKISEAVEKRSSEIVEKLRAMELDSQSRDKAHKRHREEIQR